MPTYTALTINDGQATPVAHTFSPAGLDQSSNLALYADRSTGTAIGFPTVSLRLTAPKGPSTGTKSDAERVYRVSAIVRVPMLETLGTNDAGLTPPPTVAFLAVGKVEFTLPERSSLAHRKDILAYVKNLLGQSVVTSLVQDLEPVF